MSTNVKKVKILGVVHDIEDTQARTDIRNIKSNISTLQSTDARLDDVLNEKLNKSEVGNYSSASVSSTTPISDNTQIWINPENEDNFSVPEIKDDTVNATDTWSSRKIDQELSSLKSNKADKTALSQEKAERQAEIAVERERINNLAKLEPGSTIGDAELIDARVDKDGNTYDNVGEHIRQVSSRLSEQIDDFTVEVTKYIASANINDEVYEYGRIDTSNGEIRDDEPLTANFRNINFIPVESGKTVEVYFDTSKANNPTGRIRVYQYDIDKKFISCTPIYSSMVSVSDTEKQVVLSETTKYIKLSTLANIQNFDETEISVYYLENSTKTYTPHLVESGTQLTVPYDKVKDAPKYEHIDSTRIYDNVLAMRKDYKLEVGMVCKTLGYYSPNDDGGAKYVITSSVDGTTHQENITNGLYASLIMEDGIVNVKQLV